MKRRDFFKEIGIILGASFGFAGLVNKVSDMNNFDEKKTFSYKLKSGQYENLLDRENIQVKFKGNTRSSEHMVDILGYLHNLNTEVSEIDVSCKNYIKGADYTFKGKISGNTKNVIEYIKTLDNLILSKGKYYFSRNKNYSSELMD